MLRVRVLRTRVGVRESSRAVRSALSSAHSWRSLASEAGSSNGDNQDTTPTSTKPADAADRKSARRSDKLLSFASLAGLKDRKADGDSSASASSSVEDKPEAKAKASFRARKPWKEDRHRDNRSRGKEHEAELNEDQVTRPKVRTFSFAPSASAQNEAVEKFEYPAYYDEDFPADFDNKMKMEVEKLEIFSDYVFFMDESWQEQIHPLFDGKFISMSVNCPMEDFNERLFIDDRTTYDTKVVMEVPLKCFKGLSPQGIEYVKQLVGTRYNTNKKIIKLTEDRYRTRVHNHKRLCDILHDLTQTADELSKADQVEQTAVLTAETTG